MIAIASIAAILGSIAAWRYHRLGLTLSHYDARGHLVVARRIADSITPGWQQIGAVWLPLPHLLNALPVQVDFFYRTGASAVAISIAAFAVATGAIAWIVVSLTESASAAIGAAAVFALNPNVLYLQSTPMTEPLLLALTTVSVAMLVEWCTADQADRRAGLKACTTPAADVLVQDSRRAGFQACLIGCLFALACLTRYEAWPVTAGALAIAFWVRWRSGETSGAAARAAASIGMYPAIAIVAFAIFSRIVIGEWFLSSGFFVPENKAIGDPVTALNEIGWGARELSGPVLVALGGAGSIVLAMIALSSRRTAFAAIPLSLVLTAAIPWAAFVKGHPFRIRYVVPLIAMEAIGAGVLATAIPRIRHAAAAALLVLVAMELRPLDARAPMPTEAQWDRPNVADRARVTACLGSPGSGEKIMASMGSLGHYMQEASRDGFAVRDFLHEGNGDIWLAALDSPHSFAEFVLIEEKAEGGDMLARIARERPAFLEGYRRVCEGAGMALYRRSDDRAIGDR